MILASENIQTLAKLGHETLLEMPARWLRCPWQWWWGGGCLLVYQLMFDSLRSALDFRGNMSGKSMRSILLSSLVSAVFVWKENSCPVVACLRSANTSSICLALSLLVPLPPPHIMIFYLILQDQRRSILTQHLLTDTKDCSISELDWEMLNSIWQN